MLQKQVNWWSLRRLYLRYFAAAEEEYENWRSLQVARGLISARCQLIARYRSGSAPFAQFLAPQPYSLTATVRRSFGPRRSGDRLVMTVPPFSSIPPVGDQTRVFGRIKKRFFRRENRFRPTISARTFTENARIESEMFL